MKRRNGVGLGFVIGCMSLTLAGLWGATAVSAPPVTVEPVARDKTIDLVRYFDANSLLMFVSNAGSFAYDPLRVLGRSDGLYYPKGEGKTMVFAGGIWIGAKMGKGMRVSAAEYDFDYAPGPMLNRTFQPDRPAFHVYKIQRGDSASSNPDYHDWPFDQGAPALKDHDGNDSLDESGNPIPLLLGDQTLWTVFNDVDPDRRRSDPGGAPPLGIEMQLLVWGYNVPGAIGRMIFLQYTIIDKGDSTMRDAFVGLWADPDLGNANDDLVGCDSALSLGYCYNSGPDAVYGPAPPALGYMLLRGPRVPSPAASEQSNGTVGGAITLPMTAFAKYINGTDPHFATQSYYYLEGRTRDGDPQINPVTGHVTTYMVSGDPVAGTGWLDSDPSDRRFTVSAGPFQMAPGDTQIIAAAILVGQGDDALGSITDLRREAPIARAVYGNAMTPTVPAEIDLLPGVCPNVLSISNIREIVEPQAAAAIPREFLEAAILGSATLDVTQIGPLLCSLAGVAPNGWRHADVGGPDPVRESPCDCPHEPHLDGFVDLVLRFDRAAIVQALAPIQDQESRTLTVHGFFHDGRRLAGQDCLSIIQSLIRIGPGPSIRRIHLRGNHPNPFNPATTITYDLDDGAVIRLEVFDILGRRVRTLVDEWQGSGVHEVVWDGSDDRGAQLSSGLYLSRLTVGRDVETRRMILLK